MALPLMVAGKSVAPMGMFYPSVVRRGATLPVAMAIATATGSVGKSVLVPITAI